MHNKVNVLKMFAIRKRDKNAKNENKILICIRLYVNINKYN